MRTVGSQEQLGDNRNRRQKNARQWEAESSGSGNGSDLGTERGKYQGCQPGFQFEPLLGGNRCGEGVIRSEVCLILCLR
jgi:hypothetical protein